MEFSFTDVYDLETLAEYTREYGSELAQNDASITEEVLLAREHIETALGSPSDEQVTTELNNALEKITLAIQLDSIDKTHQTELKNLEAAIKRVR